MNTRGNDPLHNANLEQGEPVTLEWIKSQPKAELHLHLLGAIRPCTALELAARHSVPFPIASEEGWSGLFLTGGLRTFVESFIALFPLLKTASDFDRVACEAFEDLAADGVTYAEPRVTITSHLSRGVAAERIGEGLLSAARYAEKELGLEIHWVIDFPRVLGIEVGRIALKHALAGRRWGVVGFDIAGDECEPNNAAALSALFREAKEKGLHLTAHAGEIGPATNIREAIEGWHVERIGHGIRAVDDPEVVALLVERRIPLEICATSNVSLGAVESLAAHPVEELRRAGVEITLNTDDPTLFGITLTEEMFRLARTFGWPKKILSEIIQNGWDHRFVKA